MRYAFNKALDAESGFTQYSVAAGPVKEHGRITSRTISIMDARKAFRGVSFLDKYPQLKTIVRYVCTSQKYNATKGLYGKESVLEMFFMSSLPFGSNASEIQKTLNQIKHSILVRWGEEGCMHAVLDNTFRQDEQQLSDPGYISGRAGVCIGSIF